MSNYTPPRPTGTNSEARYHQAVWDRIFGRPMFINTPACKWRKVGGSYIPEIKFPAASSEPDHPFKINRVSENQFTITPGFIECPWIWPGDLFSNPSQPNFYNSVSRIEITADENTLTVANAANLTPTPDLLNFEFSFDDFTSEFSVWYELLQQPEDPGKIMRVLRVEPAGENVYHAGGLSGFNTEFKLIVPIGIVTRNQIIQYALGHQANRVNTGHMRWCGEYSDDRLYFPGDVVRKKISTSPEDYQTFVHRGNIDAGWDKQLCSYGYAPRDGLGENIWQRITPPDLA